jgi:ribosomal protein L15
VQLKQIRACAFPSEGRRTRERKGERKGERKEGGKGRKGAREQVMKVVKEGEKKRGINRVGDRESLTQREGRPEGVTREMVFWGGRIRPCRMATKAVTMEITLAIISAIALDVLYFHVCVCARA